MKQTLTLVFLCITLNLFSQSKFNAENFTVTANDLEINEFKKDSTANALMIYESGNSYIDKNSFNLITEYKHKLKILNREGFDKATITVYLYNSGKNKEKFKNLIAATHNLDNGEVEHIKLKANSVFEEKYNANYTLIKFTMPKVKEGSVITYSYTLESPFKYKYRGWAFQDDIPKLYSEYKASIPANYEYNIKLVGGKKLATNESKRTPKCLSGGNGAYADCFDSVYIMKDVPAFIEEDFMTTKDNYLARIEYELKIFKGFDGSTDNITKTWKTTDKELKLDKSIGRQLSKSVGSKNLIGQEIINETDVLKKAEALYNYVQDTYTWNEKYDLFGESSTKDLLKNKSGSAAEINILLHNILDENDINVKPILISTRNNGLPTTVYPVISDFNYLIVQATINNKTYLLDATDRYLSFGELPFRCLNQYGRLLDFKAGSSWTDIEANIMTSIQYQVKLKITEDEKIEGEVKLKNTGINALYKKKNYYPNPVEYVKRIQNNYESIAISEHEVTSKGKDDNEFLEQFNIEFIDAEVIADHIYLDPFVFKFFTKNPFKLQERTYPIDFGYKDAYLYSFELDLGDKYTVEDIPKDLNIRLPNNTGVGMLNTKVNGNILTLYLKISFNNALYESEYYESLKKFMSSIVDTQINSIIVLKKK
ncbi:DUF3857 domain-containing protein [Lacinutrix iliipiscaria]|uniref:DUF3857 domain-containing protein n=1 Tax=Lacinutrix iliipiscaria TaxID=1230532 RepID=A0ABW5WRJ8_9FLAO